MATYSNQHWLLSHIRNSFISTDDSGMCETVMLSDDLPKHFLRNYESTTPTVYSGDAQQYVQEQKQQNRKSLGSSSSSSNGKLQQQELNFICYPGLDESDEEDVDFTAQSFDIQMYPEVGAHRFRSNTAQKLEKMDIARRKAARTKSINFDDDAVLAVREDFFQRKDVPARQKPSKEHMGENGSEEGNVIVKSKLTQQLESFPKQSQNKFMEFARFDGTSQTSIQTKRFNVFMSMLPERERNYPIRICVTSNAKIIEVIGLVCYKATVQFPDLPLKSVRHYALYMTEDNDDLEDFPPLDNREPCSKFGFSYLTLAERRPQVLATPNDNYHNNLPAGKSDDERTRSGLRSLTSIEVNGVHNGDDNGSNRASTSEEILDDYEEQMHSHNDMLEAPLYRTYRLQIIDKRFFKTDVTLGLSGERIEIDQHKNIKFWTKQKAATYPIDSIACCEITERRQHKAMLRIWLRSSSSSSSSSSAAAALSSSSPSTTAAATLLNQSTFSNTSGTNTTNNAFNNTSTLPTASSPMSLAHTSFAFMMGPPGQSCVPTSNQNAAHIRFKSYDFTGVLATVEHVNKKLNYILEVRSSEVRREFLEMRERKAEKSYMKKNTNTTTTTNAIIKM